LRIGVANTPPSAPRLVIVNVLPESSWRSSLPARPLSESSWISRASWEMLFVSAFRITGTRRPSGVAVAMPMW
jgi:hypothetical protein